MSAVGAALSACAGRSVDQEVAWQLYLEWRTAHPDGVVTAGPALPPAILEARVDANVDLGPCDLGVCYDPLFPVYNGDVAAVPIVSANPAVAPDPPVAVLLQDGEGVAVARPYSGDCREHNSCHDHGAVLDFNGHSYVHHECESGSRNSPPLPAALGVRLTEPPDKLTVVMAYAGTHPLAVVNEDPGAGTIKTKIPLYASRSRGRVGVGTFGQPDEWLLGRLSKVWPHLMAPPDPMDVTYGRVGRAGDSDAGWSGGRLRGTGRPSAAPRAANFDCSGLFDGGYFYGTKRQLDRLNARRCVHGATYDVGCCDDPDLPD